jgi:hypothetical protein
MTERIELHDYMLDPALSGIAGLCMLLHRHTPKPLSIEWHHIIPVAWQLFPDFTPVVPPFPGKDPSGRGMLWDARVAPLCPTSHRNVHTLIVESMREVARTNTNVVPPMKSIVDGSHHTQEFLIATEALQRYLDVGGSLLALTAAGQWGMS